MAKLAELFRRLAFWILDQVRGGQIRRHLKEVRSCFGDPDSSEIAKRQERQLRELLMHAANRCEYYSAISSPSELSAFPVVNKSLIKSNRDKFMAEGFDPGKMHLVTTSGSTGTPFQVYQDKGKINRNYADTLFYGGLAGFIVGYRLFYLKIWVEKKMLSKLAFWLRNIVPVDVIHLNDSEIESLLKKMERYRSGFSILAYASALERICQYLDRKNSPPLKTRVRCIIAMSEALNEYTRTSMEKYFGMPVVSRYSNLENGIIAQQLRGGDSSFLINSASYHVEILKMDSDDPVNDSELGRIVLTDLFNYAMPLIRYDTGDIGAMEIRSGQCIRKHLTTVEGRKLDLLYDTKGHLISSFLVYKNMWQYPEINQYQLVQESATLYIFRINAEGTFNKEEQLVNEFKSFLGQDADFRIDYVSEIPLLASGKRRKIVNNYIR